MSENPSPAPARPALGMDGLSLDQAPPLAIPMTYFLVAPLGLVTAGLLLAFSPELLTVHPPSPATLLLVHAGTLGFLTLVMMGALYQMAPVVASAAVPRVRLAFVSLGLLLLGFAGVGAWAFGHGSAAWAFYALEAGALLFALPVTWALFRSRVGTVTVFGMRGALLAFLVLVALGALLARGWSGGPFPVDRALFLEVHILFALCGWIGGLIAAVSWQVLPMFYLTPEFSAAKTWSVQAPLWLGLAGGLLTLLFVAAGQLAGAGLWVAAFLATPAALAVWWRHPQLAQRALAARRRKRADVSVDFWRAGLRIAFVLPPLALAALFVAHFTGDTRLGFLFGWLAVFGWAGLILHGMLTRIEPFLIWFHRYAPHVGRIPVPAMGRLIPAKLLSAGLRLHELTLLCGALGVLTGWSEVLRLTGVGLVLVGAILVSYAVVLLRSWPDLEVAPLGRPLNPPASPQ